MLRFERETSLELSEISPERRVSIGANVVGIWVMRGISTLLHERTLTDTPIVFEDWLNPSARLFMNILAANEYYLARLSLLHTKPDTNSHTAKEQMGLLGPTAYDENGNPRCYPNGDFILAAAYLGDETFSKKLDSEVDVASLLEQDGHALKEIHTSRAKASFDIYDEAVDLRSMVRSAVGDAEYWLEEAAS